MKKFYLRWIIYKTFFIKRKIKEICKKSKNAYFCNSTGYKKIELIRDFRKFCNDKISLRRAKSYIDAVEYLYNKPFKNGGL
jgi:ribosomal protein L7/L12